MMHSNIEHHKRVEEVEHRSEQNKHKTNNLSKDEKHVTWNISDY